MRQMKAKKSGDILQLLLTRGFDTRWFFQIMGGQQSTVEKVHNARQPVKL